MDIEMKSTPQWKKDLYEIIFEADTPAGKWFDVLLIACIIVSVITVMLDSVRSVSVRYSDLLYSIEWFFTLLFTAEYVLRLVCAHRTLRYATSFFGIIDLIAIIPTYLSLFIPATKYLLVVRILRILRVFRVLKLIKYLSEARLLMSAIRASTHKIAVFIYTVLTLVVVFGSFMYIIEGEENGFTSIPRSIYWAIVTLTTVGYGDISPRTSIGQAVAAVVMIMGYGIIAVPTGIVTVELTRAVRQDAERRTCPECGAAGHDGDAHYCKRCSAKL